MHLFQGDMFSLNSNLPRILNHSIWMSYGQKKKTWILKKQTSPLKPNIFSIQIFPPLRTITIPSNIHTLKIYSKQGFYTKRGILNLQTSIHTNPNKFHTKFHTKFHSIPYLISSTSPLLLFFLSSSFFSSLHFSLSFRMP